MRHLAGGLALEVTEQQGLSVPLAQLPEGGIEMRGDVLPARVGFGGKQFIHGGGLLFAGTTAHIGADGVRREVLRSAMQPAG